MENIEWSVSLKMVNSIFGNLLFFRITLIKRKPKNQINGRAVISKFGERAFEALMDEIFQFEYQKRVWCHGSKKTEATKKQDDFRFINTIKKNQFENRKVRILAYGRSKRKI